MLPAIFPLIAHLKKDIFLGKWFYFLGLNL